MGKGILYSNEEWARRRGYVLKGLSELERGWLAAAIDGEGSLQGRPYQRITIWNCSLPFLETAKLFAGCGTIRSHKPNAQWSNPQPQFLFEIYRIPELSNILLQVKELLVIKRDKAEAIYNDVKDGVWFGNENQRDPLTGRIVSRRVYGPLSFRRAGLPKTRATQKSK